MLLIQRVELHPKAVSREGAEQPYPVILLGELLRDQSFGSSEEPAGYLPHQGSGSLPPCSQGPFGRAVPQTLLYWIRKPVSEVSQAAKTTGYGPEIDLKKQTKKKHAHTTPSFSQLGK